VVHLVTAAAAPAGAPRRRRGTELALLVFAVVATVVAFTSAGLSHSATLPKGLLPDGLIFAGMAVLAHLAVRFLAPWADPVLLPIAIALNGLGLVVIHRLDLTQSGRGDAPMQLVWTGIGIVAFVAVLVLVRDHRRLADYTYTAMAAGLVLLALPAVIPARFSTVNGARIWIRVGGLSFQPGEIAKLLLIIFFASYLVRKREVLALAGRHVAGVDLPRGRDLGPVLIAWAASLLILVREGDLGTSLLFFGIFVVLLYVATERTSWLMLGLLLFVGGAAIADAAIPHVHQRFEIWLHTFDPHVYNAVGGSYQLAQGMFGIASGGILGTGLGQGRPQLVPFANTDFIFTTIGEELGLAGAMAVITLYLLFVLRGLRTAIATPDAFGKLLAAGLAFGFGLQVFVQIGGVTRLIPLTGMTLPFLSYGGSSLVANWILLALLLRISDAARQPSPAAAPAAVDEAATMVVRP
jgi:cell division protein FtsW (lipid II flippase)